MSKPRILLYDLEVSRQVVEGYGNKYEFKVVKVLKHQLLMSYAYKWLGDKRIHFRHMHGYSDYKEFVATLRDLQDEADICIAHNSKFDDKMSNRFFVEQGLDPPAPYRSIDTLQVARSNFKFPGNGLNDLSEFLGMGAKEKITYADIETEFLLGMSYKAIKQMQKYNIKDVELLEKLYLRLRPYMKNHPNLSVMRDGKGCLVCGNTDMIYRGYAYTATAIYRRVKCKQCGKWGRERTQDPDLQAKPEFVN